MVKWLSVANIVLLALSDRFWKPVPTGKAHWERICRKITVGYISMFILLRHCFSGKENSSLIKLVSISYALLPAVPVWWIAIDSIPLLCFAFLFFTNASLAKIDKRVFLLLLFPFLSSFAGVGFFVLALWVVGTFVQWVRQKKININLIAGFLCLAVGYILVDLKLFYTRLFLRTPLNRDIFGEHLYSITISQALKSALSEYINGGYHAPIVARDLIFPFLFLAFVSIIVFILYNLIKDRYKEEYKYLASYSLQVIILI